MRKRRIWDILYLYGKISLRAGGTPHEAHGHRRQQHPESGLLRHPSSHHTDGLYTHAIFGFLTTLLRLEGEEAPDALCVTFDVHAPTFRHQASEAYKATAKPCPEELRVQVPVLKEVLDALNIPRYEQEGWRPTT